MVLKRECTQKSLPITQKRRGEEKGGEKSERIKRRRKEEETKRRTRVGRRGGKQEEALKEAKRRTESPGVEADAYPDRALSREAVRLFFFPVCTSILSMAAGIRSGHSGESLVQLVGTSSMSPAAPPQAFGPLRCQARAKTGRTRYTLEAERW